MRKKTFCLKARNKGRSRIATPITLTFREMKKGLTLLEMIISIAIFALVASAISLIFNRSLFVYRVSINKNRAIEQARTAMEWLVRDISSATCIYEAEISYITLRNPDWGYVRYDYLGGPDTLMRSDPDDCGAFHSVSENIENFSLNYYDSLNQPTIVTSEVTEVEINLTATSGNQEFNLYTVAACDSPSADCRWAKAYGGSGTEQLLSLQQTQEGGYIFGGYTNTSDFITGGTSYDYFLVKTDSAGTITWTKTYGGTGSDNLQSLQQTQDEGYILGGHTTSFGAGNYDYLLIKTDDHGNVGAAFPDTWARTYGGTGTEQLSSLQQTQEGGYILGGHTNTSVFSAGSYDYLLIKTDDHGNVTWAKTYGGTIAEYLQCLQQTHDGGYILGGYTNYFGAGAYDYLLIKTDSTGTVTWAKTYGGTNSDRLQSLQQTLDGGYILGGYTESLGAGAGTPDFLLIKTYPDGEVDWAKTYGGTDSDRLLSLQQTQNGGYILGGQTNSPGFGAGGYDMLLIQTDVDGEVDSANPETWAKAYGSSDGDETLSSLQQTQNGGYILGGRTNYFGADSNDFFLIKTDPEGNLDCCDIVDDVTGDIDPPDSFTGVPCDDASNNIKVYEHNGPPPCDFTLVTDSFTGVPCDDASDNIKVYEHNGTPPCDFTLNVNEWPNTNGYPDFTDDVTTTPICPAP